MLRPPPAGSTPPIAKPEEETRPPMLIPVSSPPPFPRPLAALRGDPGEDDLQDAVEPLLPQPACRMAELDLHRDVDRTDDGPRHVHRSPFPEFPAPHPFLDQPADGILELEVVGVEIEKRRPLGGAVIDGGHHPCAPEAVQE